MSRIGRALAWVFPSCNASIETRARILAAMEGRDLTPAPGVCGEADPGAGQTTVAPAFHGDGGRGPGTHVSRPGPDHHHRSSDQLANDLIAWRTPS